MDASPPKLRVGGLLFPQFELLDIYGPLEFFGMLQDAVSISMIAQVPGEVTSSQGPKGVAEIALAEVADLDVLLVPGGWGTRALVQDDGFLALLRAAAKKAKFVASICTGSALLAKAGILDGKSATSNKRVFDWVTSQGPSINWVRKARWVEDGNIFTSSGVTAGMDMTLGLIERLLGREHSIQVAKGAEYIWNEDKTVDPFA